MCYFFRGVFLMTFRWVPRNSLGATTWANSFAGLHRAASAQLDPREAPHGRHGGESGDGRGHGPAAQPAARDLPGPRIDPNLRTIGDCEPSGSAETAKHPKDA